jgi:aminomethyltransferase
VVKLDKQSDFVGRAALAERSAAAPERRLVGLVGQSRRVPRHGYEVLWDGAACGTVTSGAPSPTLGVPIAMAYVRPEVAAAAGADDAGPRDPGQRDAGTADGGPPGRLAVDVRGRPEPARLVALPFYRRPA